jgi:DNA polymerase-3 subunit delta
MILILVGDDRFAIEEEIKKHKQKIDPQWQQLNYQRFGCEQLEEGILEAITVGFGGSSKVVVIENYNFREFGDRGLELLQPLTNLPESTYLIFTANSLDKRLKVAKFLLKKGKVLEYNLIPTWREDLIVKAVESNARQLQLKLSKDAVRYLAAAIGNDSARRNQELEKLKVYAGNRQIGKTEVAQLVPVNTQTSLQLAEAIRRGQPRQVAQLTEELLAKGEHPLKILATLISQFRTWLRTKLATSEGIKSNAEIARIAEVTNVKRVYYLRQEVSESSVRDLARAVTLLHELQIACQQGAKGDSLQSKLLLVCHQFQTITLN